MAKNQAQMNEIAPKDCAKSVFENGVTGNTTAYLNEDSGFHILTLSVKMHTRETEKNETFIEFLSKFNGCHFFLYLFKSPMVAVYSVRCVEIWHHS